MVICHLDSSKCSHEESVGESTENELTTNLLIYLSYRVYCYSSSFILLAGLDKTGFFRDILLGYRKAVVGSPPPIL